MRFRAGAHSAAKHSKWESSDNRLLSPEVSIGYCLKLLDKTVRVLFDADHCATTMAGAVPGQPRLGPQRVIGGGRVRRPTFGPWRCAPLVPRATAPQAPWLLTLATILAVRIH